MVKPAVYNAHYYDSIAARYNRYIAPVVVWHIKNLLNDSPIPLDGLRVLDIGTGTGIGVQLLKERGADALGIDLSIGMLKQGAQYINLLQADLNEPPFAPASFDLIVASFALNTSDPRRVFKKMCPLLRPGGWLIGQEWAIQDPLSAAFDRVIADLDLIDPDWLNALIELDILTDRWASHMQDEDDYGDRLGSAGFTSIQVAEDDRPPGLSLALAEFVTYRLAWLTELTPELVDRVASRLSSFADPNSMVRWHPPVFLFWGQRPD